MILIADSKKFAMAFQQPRIKKTQLLTNLRRHSLAGKVNLAIKVAEEVHQDQKRDSGGPYLDEHIWLIANNVLHRYNNDSRLETLLISALLHDVIEDSSQYTKDKIASLFSRKVAQIVQDLTKTEQEQAKGKTHKYKYNGNKSYLKRLGKSIPESTVIKIEDRLANLQTIQVDTVNIKPEKYQRYVKETIELYLPLARRLNDSINYEKLLLAETDRVQALLESIKA